MSAVFLDTNIFLYVIGTDSEFRAPSAAILRAVAEGGLVANTNTDVVQEVLFVLSRRGARDQAAKAARSILGLFPNLLPVLPEDLLLACDLLQRFPTVSARDTVHAATMARAGLRDILSADKHFDAMPDLRRIDPLDARGLSTLLR